MTLTPNFLPVGSIVEYNGAPCIVIEILRNNCIATVGNSGHISEFNGIPLTPEILTEWCGFEKESDMSEKDATWTIKYVGFTCVHDERDEIGIFANGGNSFTVLFNEQTLTVITHLHQLQHLYSALTQTVLPITIK